MRAVRIHAANDVRIEDVKPRELKPDECLIRVKAVGICATDVELCDGSMFFVKTGMAKLPMTPGHEWAGEVVETGKAVTNYAPGDRVVGECAIGCRSCDICLTGHYQLCRHKVSTGVLNFDGAFAEYIVYPYYFLHRFSNHLSYPEASLIEPAAVALQPVRVLGVTPADTVAVIGPGPIGICAAQAAKAYGAKQVILIGTRDSRLDLARELGVDATINIRKKNGKERMTELTDGRMADVIIESAGKSAVWPLIVDVAAPMARVGMTGLFGGETCEVDFDPLVTRQISVHGFVGSANMWDETISLVERGLMKLEPMITHRLPLNDFLEGLEIATTRRDGAIKVVIEP